MQNPIEQILAAIERQRQAQQSVPFINPNILTPSQIVITESSEGRGVERLDDVQPMLSRIGAFNN
jgi:hypothetical protein